MPHQPASPTAASARSPRSALWTLAFGNFVIGSGVLLPTGMLAEIARALQVSEAQAGMLMLASGIVIGLGAPLAAALTSRIDRRLLLAAALGLYALGHLASALAPSFSTLLVIRCLMIIAAGIFTPQAAATVGLIVPAEQRASQVAFIFLGWSLSIVAGSALSGVVAAVLGWQAVYLAMTAVSLVGVVLVLLTLPKGLTVPRLSFASWGAVLGNPALLLVLLVTVLNSAGQLTAWTYAQPTLMRHANASVGTVAVIFTILGIAGVVGNACAARLVTHLGSDRTVLVTLALVFAGLLTFGLGLVSPAALVLPVVITGGIVWGLGTFSSNSLQQGRLIAMSSALASASVALNTSAIYVGQAIGPLVGRPLVEAELHRALPWVGGALLAVAMALSVAAARMGRAATH